MKTTDLKSGAVLYEFDRHEDSRGHFQEVFSTKRYPMDVKQANLSCSKKGVVRGLHVAPFAKLCTCVSGKLFDVAVDVRPDSPTFLKWDGVWLEAGDNKQLYIPAGYAHGFFSAEDDTLLLYMQESLYDPEHEYEINWRDIEIGIEWPEHSGYILSDKDRKAKSVRECQNS